MDCKWQEWKREIKQEDYSRVMMARFLGGTREAGQKWMHLRYILEVEWSGLSDASDVGLRKRGRSKSDSGFPA